MFQVILVVVEIAIWSNLRTVRRRFAGRFASGNNHGCTTSSIVWCCLRWNIVGIPAGIEASCQDAAPPPFRIKRTSSSIGTIPSAVVAPNAAAHAANVLSVRNPDQSSVCLQRVDLPINLAVPWRHTLDAHAMAFGGRQAGTLDRFVALCLCESPTEGFPVAKGGCDLEGCAVPPITEPNVVHVNFVGHVPCRTEGG